MMRRLTVVGCSLWIAGLAAFLIGLNLPGQAGSWLAIAGNILFLVGLGLTGFVWFRKKRDESAASGGMPAGKDKETNQEKEMP